MTMHHAFSLLSTKQYLLHGRILLSCLGPPNCQYKPLRWTAFKQILTNSYSSTQHILLSFLLNSSTIHNSYMTTKVDAHISCMPLLRMECRDASIVFELACLVCIGEDWSYSVLSSVCTSPVAETFRGYAYCVASILCFFPFLWC